MLFNSYQFLLVYLPITFFGFFAIATRSRMGAAAWLTAASLGFYAWWSAKYLLLLLGSITFNYLFGTAIARAIEAHRQSYAKALLTGAVVVNLSLLAYYKYANFFLDSINSVAHSHLAVDAIVLPLGISFFTFTQIAFLVDAYHGHVRNIGPCTTRCS